MNINQFFHGSEYAEKIERFDLGVKNIEASNPNLFEEGDLSMKFLISTPSPNIVRFGFTESVPVRIEKEVRALFHSLFQKI